MAILRGGKRIGGIDIGIGIPRDRSLDNVLGDPRLKQRQGGSAESTLGRFISQIAEGEGFARPNRFLVDFILPNGVAVGTDVDNGALFEEEISQSTVAGELQQHTQLQRGLRGFCFNVEMPSRQLTTTEFKTYGPQRDVVTGENYTREITCSFYADKFLRQRIFFELWQAAAFDQKTHNVHFYNEYTGGIRIYQLGAFAGDVYRDRMSYGVELTECYPKSIVAVPYNYGPNEDVQKVDITFAFRQWSNLSLDQVNKFTVGGGFKVPTIKEPNRGFIGNILSKLPPEIRRAGRDAINVIKQRVPIGSVFGGKVFPPFL
tara:strand:- start:789 stop:1739 length:951 start_codon:yes stop_codon:yes gene_type:complete